MKKLLLTCLIISIIAKLFINTTDIIVENNIQPKIENCFKNVINALTNPNDKVKALYEDAQTKYKKNSMYIEAVQTLSYVRRKNNTVDSTKSYIKYYKSDNKWRSDIFTDWEIQDNEIPTFISVFDGNALHDYVNLYNKDTEKTISTELSINKGEIIYEQERAKYPKLTLNDIINDFNHANDILNWIPKERKIIIKEDKIINGYPCTNIISKDVDIEQETCVSKDYGAAIYIKRSSIVKKENPSYDVNKLIISEYEIKKIENSEQDLLSIDNEIFKLPQIKPQHIYGKW